MLKNLFVFLIIGLSITIAQTYSPKISSSSNLQNRIEADDQNINILAVMVEFQPDDFDLTYGNGTFGSIYSEDYGSNIIDPLPHNQQYFEDHLQFAVNYFGKVSKGKVTIEYNVLPNIYTVSKPMREYSPLEGESFEVLGEFSKEVWQIVGEANPTFDFFSL